VIHHLTYAEAIVVGLFQGVTELFPVSSLGHSVLIPALVGGSWAQDLSVTAPDSPYLAFIVGLHVATAIAMIIYFWRDWVRIVIGFLTSIRDRRVETVDQRLAWMIILGTIPVGVVGALLQHTVQKTFAKPVVTAIFLAINGVILFGGERLRRRQVEAAEGVADDPDYGDYDSYQGHVDPALARGGGDQEGAAEAGQHDRQLRAGAAQQAKRRPPSESLPTVSLVVVWLTPLTRSRLPTPFSSSATAVSSRSSPPVSATMPSAFGSASGADGRLLTNSTKPIA